MNQTALEAEAFAELVRKMSGRIYRALTVNAIEEAKTETLSLLEQALDRKREFQAIATRSDPNRFDLSSLSVDLENEHPEE